MTPIKRIDIKEFREFGYLQELNRQFLHPLGLALEVLIDDVTGEETLGGIWDYREDEDGMAYNDLSGCGALNKAQRVKREQCKKSPVRKKMLGFNIQPIGHKFREDL
jgi:hypothetical protein